MVVLLAVVIGLTGCGGSSGSKKNKTFGGRKGAHGAIRSALTMALSPQVIAARVRHAFGTLTSTGGAFPRTARPALRQVIHGLVCVGWTCRR